MNRAVTKQSALVIGLAAALIGWLAQPALAAPWRTAGAGGESHAWFLTPVELPTGPDGAPVMHGQMFRASVSGDLGAVFPLRAHSIFEPPLFMTGYGERLMLIYEASSNDVPATAVIPSESARSFPVRSVRIHEAPVGAHLVPPNRYFAEAPLIADGEIIAASDTALGLAAMARAQNSLSLHILTRTGWTEAALPSDLNATDRVQLLANGSSLSILAQTDTGAAVWTLPAIDGAWERRSIHPSALDSTMIATPGGVIASTYDDAAQALRFSVVMESDVADLQVIDGVAPDHAVARLGENLMVLWMDTASPDRMRVAVISSITGRVLHNDFASFGPPLTPSDLRLVAFLLSAIMLGVLLFLLKPETAIQAAPPPGWALADSGRRFLAAAIDFLLAGFISSLIWPVQIMEAIDPSHLFLMDSGDNWPAMTSLGIYLLHGAVGEWLFGRTLGKLLLRCRVSSTRGAKLKFWQAVARNLVKVMAPPLVALVLIDPNRRHPGDLLGGTLVVSPAEPEDQPDDGDVPGSAGKSDNPDLRNEDRQD